MIRSFIKILIMPILVIIINVLWSFGIVTMIIDIGGIFGGLFIAFVVHIIAVKTGVISYHIPIKYILEWIVHTEEVVEEDEKFTCELCEIEHLIEENYKCDECGRVICKNCIVPFKKIKKGICKECINEIYKRPVKFQEDEDNAEIPIVMENFAR